MLWFALILGFTLILSVLPLLVMCGYYLSVFRRFRTPAVPDLQLPEAAVIMCLRGPDPFLNRTLDQLADLDYPHYQLYVIVDSRQDPARNIVETWMRSHPGLCELQFLERFSSRSTLKCSALRQVVQGLPSNVQVIALADADIEPSPSWLRDLVSPLINDAQLGVVTGNRWYAPQRGRWGSLVRYAYNACSIAPMYFMNALWAGSTALKREVFSHPEFLKRLTEVASDEHAISDAARAAGLRVTTSPRVMLLNREETTLTAGFRFIMRQLLWTRLYHSAWWALVAHATLSYVSAVVLFLLMVYWLINHELAQAATVAATLAVYLVLYLICLTSVQRAIVSRLAADHGEKQAGLPAASYLKLPMVLFVTFFVYFYTVLGALLTRKVQWRGVKYRVALPNGIELVEYRPFENVKSADDSISVA